VSGAVLVTGGSGYLGSLVVRRLVGADLDVLSLDVRPPLREVPGAEHVTADLRSDVVPALLRDRGVRAVVHLAAVVDPPREMSEDTLRDIEVGGTERLLDACVSTGVEHLTVASSGAAYGYHLVNRGHALREEDPVRGSDAFAYSRHKAEVERLLARYRRLHPELGQLVLRPGTILGADTHNQITELFEKRVMLGLRDSEIPFVFIWDRDVVEVVARGVLGRVTGTYNLAGDGVMTVSDIAEIEGARVLRLPAGLLIRVLRVARRLGVGRYGPEQVDFLRYRPVLANDRLKRDFPGLPTRTSQEAYEVYRAGRSRRGGS
jgi:UDP-glucose 4-epimerase